MILKVKIREVSGGRKRLGGERQQTRPCSSGNHHPRVGLPPSSCASQVQCSRGCAGRPPGPVQEAGARIKAATVGFPETRGPWPFPTWHTHRGQQLVRAGVSGGLGQRLPQERGSDRCYNKGSLGGPISHMWHGFSESKAAFIMW